MPESIGQLTALTGLNLSHNQISLIPESIRKLNIKDLDLGNQTGVTIKVKKLKLWWHNPFLSPDYWFVAVPALMGYADFVTDVLSIIQLGQAGSRA